MITATMKTIRFTLNSLFTILLVLFALSLLTAAGKMKKKEKSSPSLSIPRWTSKFTYPDKANIDLTTAIQNAQSAVPGFAIKAELDRDDGFLIYEVLIIDSGKMLWEVEVDAGDGVVLEIEQEENFEDKEENEVEDEDQEDEEKD